MIITNEEQLLRIKCEEVIPEEVVSLIQILEKELDHANRLGRGGIGLAAPQIGIAKKIAIVRIGNVKIDLVNCQVAQGFDPTIFEEEGCLSFPGKTQDTLRFQEVYITGNLVEPYSFTATGLLSIVVQHEIDHYNSTLFMDRTAPKSITTIKKEFKVGANDLCPCGSNIKYKRCCRRK